MGRGLARATHYVSEIWTNKGNESSANVTPFINLLTKNIQVDLVAHTDYYLVQSPIRILVPMDFFNILI